MTASKPAKLIEILGIEINFLDQLVALLSTEKEALVSRQFENLESLASQKEEISKILEDHTKHRIALLGLNSQARDPKLAMKEFLNECSNQEAEQIKFLNQSLSEKLILCRELNAVNGQVITSNINTRQEIINAITGQNSNEATATYTATGNLSSSTESGRHQKA